MKNFRIVVIFSLSLAVSLFSQQIKYPATDKQTVVDTYFGVEVPDPYRWLENDKSEEVKKWVDAQNKITFDYLDKIPYRQKIKERLTNLWNYPKYSSPFREGKNFFYYKNDGLQNQSVLYIQKSLDAEPELFFDPNKFSEDGTVSLSGASFSKDGKNFAYSISRSGSDWREIYVMEVNTREKYADELHRAKWAGISWYKDGFYYAKYDEKPDSNKSFSAKDEFHKIYYHKLNTSQKDDELIYEDKNNPLRIFSVSVTEDERFLFLSASESAGKGNALYVRDMKKKENKFLPIIETVDDVIYAIDNVGEKIILFTKRNALNGRLISVDSKNPSEKYWKELVPEKSEVLMSVSEAGGKLFLTYLKDVTPRVYQYDMQGKFEREIVLPEIGTVSGFSGKKDDKFVFFTISSFTTPATIYRYDIPTAKISVFRKPEIDFPFENYVTNQVFYKSKDGTNIPMFIVHKKDIKLDGSNPTWLYAYGGFNAIMAPSFSPARLAWLEQGGVYAMANIRGGNEYGERWHEAGMLLQKQNVFDDFIAAAEYLIQQKYTSSEKLALHGISNGGLLVGAVINQRPELSKVAFPAVGVMDMLRFHKFTIGWAWVDEYGSSEDLTHFRNLFSYSPLHNIREGINYPATLVTTADHDDRVVPAHSFKYIATLQEKYKGDNPVLIRIETKAGHGAGKPTSKIIEETADMYTFAFYNMRIIY